IAGRFFHLFDADIGRPFSDFAPHLAGVDLVPLLQEVVRSFTPIDREVETIDRSAWFMLRILPYRTGNVVTGAVVTLTDITKLKSAEADLRRLATVVKDSNDAITVQDLEGRILAWNRGAVKMYGYSEDEALKMNIRALIPEEARSWPTAFESVKRGEEITSLEVKRRTKDGRTLDIWQTSTKLVDEHGRPVAVATTERDITKMKRAEAGLRRLAAMVKDSSDAITVQDLEGRILAWNPSAAKMYGYSEDEALKMNIEALVPEEAWPQTREFLETVKRGEEILSLEVKRRTKDG